MRMSTDLISVKADFAISQGESRVVMAGLLGPTDTLFAATATTEPSPPVTDGTIASPGPPADEEAGGEEEEASIHSGMDALVASWEEAGGAADAAGASEVERLELSGDCLDDSLATIDATLGVKNVEPDDFDMAVALAEALIKKGDKKV